MPPSPPDAPSPAVPAPGQKPADKTALISSRNLLELTVLLLITVVLVRSFLVEAYIVPTGSMAPALSGHHKLTRCPCCGAPVRVGHRGSYVGDPATAQDREAERNYRRAFCPNCGWDDLDLDRVAECLGDRLLVHKHIYELRKPQRWEMVVFRNPDPQADPTADTLIKRLVGLPGERVQIRDGDVWIDGAIARKSLAQLEAMLLPVFDNDHLPKDAPRPFRWSGGKSSAWTAQDSGRQFSLKAGKPAANYDWLQYRHLVREAGAWKEDHLRDELGYNGGQERGRLIHDVLLDCQVQVNGSGVLAIALTDGLDDILIELPAGAATERARTIQVGARPGRPGLATSTSPLVTAAYVLPEQHGVRLQAGIADRRLFLAVDGEEIFGTLDLPTSETRRERATLQRPLALGGHGPVSLSGRGIDIQVSHLRVWRDIHYTEGDGRDQFPHGIASPVSLGPDQFFVLGDNSGNSYDSRCWKTGPAVHGDMLVGKAFFIHLPSRVVHREFLGRTWTAQTPDWPRIHWIR